MAAMHVRIEIHNVYASGTGWRRWACHPWHNPNNARLVVPVCVGAVAVRPCFGHI